MARLERSSSVGKVTQVIDNNAIVQFSNGNTAVYDISTLDDVNIGSVLLISQDLSGVNYIDLVSPSYWIDNSIVGVVKLKTDDLTIVEIGNGQWIKIDTSLAESYEEGYTVEFSFSQGVIKTLSKKPLSRLSLPKIDEETIAKYRTNKEDLEEKFEDFGGYSRVVERAQELITISLNKRMELQEIGAKPIKGVLFTGLPGTGKTMLARIIANSTKADFYYISGPEILSKWYGQSEEVLRILFEDAAKQDQAIIFFDEIDSIAGHRNDGAHEASRRVVAQLLSLMDGFEKNNVIVIAATNRPENIDMALRRPGRFDWEIDFPLPNEQDREDILRASAKKRKIKDNVDYSWIAKNTINWSAADLVAIWKEASLLTVSDDRKQIRNEDLIGGFERVRNNRNQANISKRGIDDPT